MVLIYITAIFCMMITMFKTRDTLYEITNDFNNNIYLEVGLKEYNKENVVVFNIFFSFASFKLPIYFFYVRPQ